ncbi:hypothetical protein ULF88_05160 [Halopseudomonas pachastrellae]|nr:hypothetical protein [Halopseudomonas pachastrellae]
MANHFFHLGNEQVFRPDAIERQLAHVESNKVRATYNKAILLSQRREMMQAWADYLSAAEEAAVIHLSQLPSRHPRRLVLVLAERAKLYVAPLLD